ncbi:MAG: UDP-glucose 4-epimerase GalE [Alphaproteobacteria bacterium]|nr:UDP-glucose 4-epimerase GalE [Alphaproteobacteria bacterium]
MTSRVLVTGGAGFVGSHAVAALLARGDEVCVFDNLSTGHRDAVLPGARLVEGDLADHAAIDAVLAGGRWDAVLHFASLSLVGESMREPMLYLRTNVGNGLHLIDRCIHHGVGRFVLSSTAALFGNAPPGPIDEAAAIEPGSPYGESKAALERALLWADRIHGLKSAVLRYFNAAGADPEGRLGEDHRPESHLIPLVIDAALGRRGAVQVFGTDYDTPDGTCIRDYIHVSDLADAHVRALARLDHGSVTYNLGNSTGHSVREVIAAVERVGGRPVPHHLAPRRAGDPATLVAASVRIARETGWQPRFAALDEIVRTAWAWRAAHPHGYAA